MPAARPGELLSGYLLLAVAGERPAAFLDALLAARIPFRQARVAPDGLSLRLGVPDFRRIRPAARTAGVRVRIRRRAGLPFWLARARRRPALLGALLAGAVLLYVLSGHIWFVQVTGSDRAASAEILRAAGQLGLQPGARRAGLDAQDISRRLPVAVPQLAWASVQLHGTLAIIQVVERAEPAPAYAEAGLPGDVVAAHAGIVAGLTVTAGAAAVQPGEAVQAGQVLIRGLVQMPVARTRQSGLEGLRAVPVHAAGLVLAVQTYRTYAESPGALEVGVPTGAVAVRRALLVGGRTLPLDWRAVPFSAYRLEREVSPALRWRNVALPLELLTLRYVEVTRQVRLLSPDAARAVAAAQARAFLLPQLPPHGRILRERQQSTLLPGGRVGVELWVESEDNIGVFRPAGPPAAPPPPAGVAS